MHESVGGCFGRAAVVEKDADSQWRLAAGVVMFEGAVGRCWQPPIFSWRLRGSCDEGSEAKVTLPVRPVPPGGQSGAEFFL